MSGHLPLRSAVRLWVSAWVILILGCVALCSCGTPPPQRSAMPDNLSAAGTGVASTVTLKSGTGAALTVTSAESMQPGSEVSSSGSAVAKMTFSPGTSHESACALQSASSGVGQATSRVPTSALLELTQGTVSCTVPASPTLLHLCGPGVVYATGQSQFAATCDSDPVFAVAVLHGAVHVVDPSGVTNVVTAGERLSCNPATCGAKLGLAVFTDLELLIFGYQAKELSLSWPPPTTTIPPTTVPPTTTSNSSTDNPGSLASATAAAQAWYAQSANSCAENGPVTGPDAVSPTTFSPGQIDVSWSQFTPGHGGMGQAGEASTGGPGLFTATFQNGTWTFTPQFNFC